MFLTVEKLLKSHIFNQMQSYDSGCNWLRNQRVAGSTPAGGSILSNSYARSTLLCRLLTLTQTLTESTPSGPPDDSRVALTN
jgi:hypothetical protein